MEIPENFSSIVFDFVSDLDLTFPEYSYLWSNWKEKQIPQLEQKKLFDYMLTVFPERFFDILYQNEDIFKDPQINTAFFPNVDFKYLYNCPGVSDKTRKTMWKYLQLVLINILGSIKNKSIFGETMNMFDGIDEGELHGKLEETINSINTFFTSFTDKEKDGDQCESDGDQRESTPLSGEDHVDPDGTQRENEYSFSKDDVPNLEELHEHLKGLFDGKIGSLAKELAEEISNDISGLFDEDDGDISEMKSTQDVIKKLMKNPKKMMDLVKKVGGKLTKKMESGEISQEEIMKEASSIFSQMKEMGGKGDMNNLFKNLAKQMGGMGGMGSGAKVDMNAFSNKMKNQNLKDKLRSRLDKKREEQQEQQKQQKQQTQPDAFLYKKNDTEFVFTKEEKQEKTPIDSIQKKEDVIETPKPKKNNKKGKK